MTLLAFFLGLALGLGCCLLQHRRIQRQLRQTLALLPLEATNSALPPLSRLRQAVTYLNRQQDQLESEVHIRQQLLHNAPLGYLQVDRENQLIWCNQQARQLLQIDRWESGQVRLLLELVRSYELDRLIEQTRECQKPDIREWVFHPSCIDGMAMGKVRPLTLRAYSWPLPERQVGVFLENQQPLVELTKLRNQWVSDLAHELRTPLTSIHLVAEALQNRLEGQQRHWIERMLREIERLVNLVQDWLELSCIEKNPTQSLTYQSTELQSLIEVAWQALEPLAEQKQLKFTKEGPQSLWLQADPTRLIQVFVNLLDNSIKHSPPCGTIYCAISQLAADSDGEGVSDDWIEIDIIDSGKGFSPSDLPYVFERLYRGEASRYRLLNTSSGQPMPQAGEGSGLGLSIVQEIVEAHGGGVVAKNHPDTGGGWLQVKLPANKALR